MKGNDSIFSTWELNTTRASQPLRQLRSLQPLRQLRFVLLLLAAAAALLGMLPGSASAHSQLQESVPAASTRVDASPQQVRLTFNERIEPAVRAVQVLDSKSNPVTSAKPTLSEDHKTLSLALPKLGEGLYTVSYRIISEDGHPIGGSYVFVVGNPPAVKDASTFDLHAQIGHSGHEGGGRPVDGCAAALRRPLPLLHGAAPGLGICVVGNSVS